MDSIDTSTKSSVAAFDPPYVLLETQLPNSGGKEYLPIRNYNPQLIKPKKEENQKKEEDDDQDEADFADKKVIRVKSKKVPDLQSIQRKDLFFHSDHGYLKVTHLKFENEDDEESSVKSIKCCKLDSKGKKTDDEVELTKKDLKKLTN